MYRFVPSVADQQVAFINVNTTSHSNTQSSGACSSALMGWRQLGAINSAHPSVLPATGRANVRTVSGITQKVH